MVQQSLGKKKEPLANCLDFVRPLTLCEPPKITVFLAQGWNPIEPGLEKSLSTMLSKHFKKQLFVTMLLNVGCELTATSWTKMNSNHEYIVWHQTLPEGMVALSARWNRVSAVSVEAVGWKKEQNDEFANWTLILLETQLHKSSWKKMKQKLLPITRVLIPNTQFCTSEPRRYNVSEKKYFILKNWEYWWTQCRDELRMQLVVL